ncbi:MAG: hypothetical protein KDA24_07350 [Deltaproteobacteria bacterium]|nr:hypothetical protein [Deltaproteobacteria bacterium]
MRQALLPLLALLLAGCPPTLGADDDDAVADDDDATMDDDDAANDDDDVDDDDAVDDDDDNTTDPVDDDDSTTDPGDDDDATSSDDDDVVGDDDDTTGPLPVEICNNTSSNAFVVDAWSINGDELEATVSYGGGCAVHDFHACWDGLFLESWPVQVNLVLEDWGPPDPCLAYITETHTFDLSPLQTAWLQSYMAPGEIIVNVDGGSDTYSF